MESSEPVAAKTKSLASVCGGYLHYLVSGRNTLNGFLGHLNSQHSDTKFTMEVEKNGGIPFLNALVTCKLSGRLSHSVYRRPTYTDRYLHVDSHHHPVQMSSVVNSLGRRAVSIFEPDNLSKEPQHVKPSLQNNAQTLSYIRALLRQPSTILKWATTYDETPVVEKYCDIYGRKIRKAMEIHKHSDNINRENGYYLSAIWKPLLRTSLPFTQSTVQAWRSRPIYGELL
ncbi:hypothetical protein Trydic_g6667 [Trypoxylus dichotomus]